MGRASVERRLPLRSPGIAVLCAAALLAVSGCTAYRYPLLTPQEERHDLDGSVVPRLTLAVPRPALELPPDDGTWESHLARERVFDEFKWSIYRAEALIRKLGETGYFAEVGFADELTHAADLTVEPIQGPPHQGVDGQNFMVTALTLGLLPVSEVREQGTYFRTDTEREFRCDWQEQALVGWVAGLFLLAPSWTGDRDEDAYDYNLRRCLVEQSGSVFEAQE